MNTTLCKTEKCGQMLEIKIASGYKDPKNKGKKYTKCLKCDAFNWVEENENSKSPKEFEQSLLAPAIAQKGTETREPIQDFRVNPKVWEDKDLKIARESALHTASRNHMGKEVDPALLILEANEYVDFIYNGLKSTEEVGDVILPSEIMKEDRIK